MINKARLGIEVLEERLALAASIVEHNDVGYFFDSSSNVVGRYDIQNKNWLAPVTLRNTTTGPTVVHVDSNGIYAGFGQSIYRYNSDGTGRTHLINLQSPAIAIHSDGNLLFLNHSVTLYSRFVSINKNNNTVIDSVETYINALSGSSIAPSLNTLYGRSIGISPPDITYQSYDNNGRFTSKKGDSPYHGSYPGATRTWIFPDETKVVDDSGIVYATSNLTYANRLSRIQDVDFLGGQLPFVLFGKDIVAHSRSFLPTGVVTLASNADKIFISSDSVIAFFRDNAASFGYRTQSIPLAEFKPPNPTDPIDPTGLAYTPDWLAVSTQGRALLLSKAHQNIFRWNPTTQSYDRSIGLLGSPSYAAYSRLTDTIYVLYNSGLIYQIDLKVSEPKEIPFCRIPGNPLGLSVAGEFVFAADDSGAWNSHYIISPQGVIISSRDWNYFSRDYVWNSINRRMYFMRDDTSPNDLLYEPIDATGQLQPPVDSPYHDSIGWTHPIRLSPDGSVVALGSGILVDASTLQKKIHALDNGFTDATWFAGRLLSVRTIAGIPQLQQWIGPTFELSEVKQWDIGSAFSIQAITNNRLLVTNISQSGVPTFTILDSELSPATVNVSWHNSAFPMDVDDDLTMSPLDVLTVVNQINRFGSWQTEGVGEYFCDVDKDGSISPLDALVIINAINSKASGEGEASLNEVSAIDYLFASNEEWNEESSRKTRRSLAGRNR